jgi:hypothetical protein
VKDKMNVKSCLRVCQPGVWLEALPLLHAGVTLADGKVLQLDTQGLQVYLEMMWAMAEIYLGDVTLEGRVELASFVCHMIYLGKAAMLNGKHVELPVGVGDRSEPCCDGDCLAEQQSGPTNAAKSVR